MDCGGSDHELGIRQRHVRDTVEYYVYSINHGQDSALDGPVRTHGLMVACFVYFLYDHILVNDSCNEPF